MPDFWEEMQGAYSVESSLDVHLQDRTLEGEGVSSVQALTDKMRAAKALPLPAEAGTRVKFVANLGSVLLYPDIPDTGVLGTVVTVKTADGNVTHQASNVFIMWDDGKFRPIHAEHLRHAVTSEKRASAFRMVASRGMDLTALFDSVTGRENELVHKATKDLWAVRKDGKKYVIERLFREDGEPLKV